MKLTPAQLRAAARCAALRICRSYGIEAEKEKHVAEDGVSDVNAADEIQQTIEQELRKLSRP